VFSTFTLLSVLPVLFGMLTITWMHGDWPFDMQILGTSGVISVLFNAPMFYVCGERSHNFIFGPSINRSASFSVVDVQLIKVCICIYSNTGSCHSHVPARNRSTHVSALRSIRTARSDLTKLFCRVASASAVWIGFSTTEGCRQRNIWDLDTFRAIVQFTLQTSTRTPTRQFCRVWFGGVNWSNRLPLTENGKLHMFCLHCDPDMSA